MVAGSVTDTPIPKIDISVGELESALCGPPNTRENLFRLQMEVAARKPEWAYFRRVFNRNARRKEFMGPDDDAASLTQLSNQVRIEDLIVPDELARIILAESGRYGYMLPDGRLLNGPDSRAISKISYLDLYHVYGGGFLEGMYEKGINDPKDPYLSDRQRRELCKRV